MCWRHKRWYSKCNPQRRQRKLESTLRERDRETESARSRVCAKKTRFGTEGVTAILAMGEGKTEHHPNISEPRHSSNQHESSFRTLIFVLEDAAFYSSFLCFCRALPLPFALWIPTMLVLRFLVEVWVLVLVGPCQASASEDLPSSVVCRTTRTRTRASTAVAAIAPTQIRHANLTAVSARWQAIVC